MTDLTALTTPLGLLDCETQKALKAHVGPFQYYNFAGGWSDIYDDPAWSVNSVYRVKPAPPKPREWWVREQEARETAEWRNEEAYRRNGWVHVREVLPE